MKLSRKIRITLLAAILLLAALLRLHAIGAQSFWLDELLSLEASAGRGQTDQALPRGQIIEPGHLTKLQDAPPPWKVWTTLEKDSHPPLYYLLLRGWRDIVGDDEACIRLMSAIWSLIAIGMIYLVGRRLAGDLVGLCAAELMTLSPLQVLYAQEARNYSMLCATTLFTAWAYLRAEEKDSIARWAILSASLLAAMLTHYLAAPVLAAIAIYAVLRCRGRKLARIAIAFGVAAIVYAVIWGPFLAAQRDSFRRNREGAFDSAAGGSISQTLIRAGCEPLRQIGGKPLDESPAATVLAGVVALLLIGSFILLRGNTKAILPHLWLVCPLLFLSTVDILAHDATLTFPRYTVVCGPGVFLLLGWLAFGDTVAPRPPRQFIGIALILLAVVYSAISLPLAYHHWKADWRTLADSLAQNGQDGDVIVLATNQPQTWWLGGAVLGITHYSSHPFKTMLLDRPAIEAESAQIPHGWLVIHGMSARPEELLPNIQATPAGSDPQIGAVYRIMSARR